MKTKAKTTRVKKAQEPPARGTPPTMRRALMEGVVLARAQLDAFRRRYEGVLMRCLELEEELERLCGLARDAAVRDVTPGETTCWWRSVDCEVKVCGPVASPTYDASVALAIWPAEVTKKCLLVDGSAARTLCDAGLLEKGRLKAAEVAGVDLAPRVTFDFAGARLRKK